MGSRSDTSRYPFFGCCSLFSAQIAEIRELQLPFLLKGKIDKQGETNVMYPNAFLQTFWRASIRPTVFVAMSFAPAYTKRFETVIEPAIRTISTSEGPLVPHRVDISRSGDSIITEIVDGIAHARLVLADVSSIGKDSISGNSFRNGNVMYEVGIALACRQSQDVLLVRDDHDPFLFDVSAIPHITLDFTADDATTRLRGAMQDRLAEQDLVGDARVKILVSTLTNTEAQILRALADLPDDHAMSFQIGGLFAHYELGLGRLLDKGLIHPVEKANDNPAYRLTTFGRAAIAAASHLLPTTANVKPQTVGELAFGKASQTKSVPS